MTRPCVVFVPGMWGTASQFKKCAEHVRAAGFPATTIELRGHITGSSPKGYTVQNTYGPDTRTLITQRAELEGQEFVLIAHSMGALAAQIAAANNPHVVGLVLVAGAPPRGTPLPADVVWELLTNLRYPRGMLTGKPIQLLRKHRNRFFLNKTDNKSIASGAFCPESGAALRHFAIGSVIPNWFWQRFGKYLPKLGHEPVDRWKLPKELLVIGLGADRVITRRIVEAEARRLGVTPVWVEGVDHSFFFHPEQVMPVITAWLKQKFSRPATPPTGDTKVVEFAKVRKAGRRAA